MIYYEYSSDGHSQSQFPLGRVQAATEGHQGDRRQNTPPAEVGLTFSECGRPSRNRKALSLSRSCGEENKSVLNLKGSNDDRDECIMQFFSEK